MFPKTVVITDINLRPIAGNRINTTEVKVHDINELDTLTGKLDTLKSEPDFIVTYRIVEHKPD